MIFFLSGKTIFYERAQRVSKILFLPRENKIHIFAPLFDWLKLNYTAPRYITALHPNSF